MPKNKSFLIVNPFGIGDVLFSTPLLKNIKQTAPEGRIFYLCNRRSQSILESHPLVDRCFVYERDEFEALKLKSKISWLKGISEFISDIQKERIDIALDLSLNTQFGFICWAAGIKRRIGYNYKNRGWFLTKKIKLEGYKDKHVVEYYLDLLKAIDIEPRHKQIKLFLKSDQKQLVGNSLTVVIAPGGGASWGRQSYRKHWDKNKFAQLADRLIEDLGAKIIISGSADEKDIVDAVAGLMRNQPVKAVGRELNEYLSLLNKAKLLIANDGGPIHMAAGLGLKTVSIFGPVDEKVYGPYPPDHSKHVVIKKDLSCRPCYRSFRLPECLYDIMCLNNITVNEVFEAAEKLLLGRNK